jgi:predicted  nucleic acid-binding Zn-ribbon protein
MQIRCEHCGHEGEAADARSVEGAIWVVCGSCGEASPLIRPSKADAASPPAETTRYATTGALSAIERVEMAPPPKPSAPAAGLLPHKCPKCSHRQDDAFACHKCGLVFANAQKRRPWDEIPPNRKVAYGRVESAFRALVANDTDAAAHAQFEALAVKEQAVEYAIRLYRHHLADYPADEVSAVALSGLVQRAQMVAQSLAREQIKSTVGDASRSLKWGAAAIVVLLLAVAGFWLIRLMKAQQHLLP